MKTRTIAHLHGFRIPPRNGEAQHREYGRFLRGMTICSSCGNVYYRKEWRRRSDVDVVRAFRAGVARSYTLCPACSLASKGLFEGEVLLRNIPAVIEQEVMRLVRGFARRAEARDPQHRVVAIERLGNVWRITTTENQLAIKLAKKIRDTFKRVVMTISHSQEPFEVGRVRILFA